MKINKNVQLSTYNFEFIKFRDYTLRHLSVQMRNFKKIYSVRRAVISAVCMYSYDLFFKAR